MSSRIGYIRGMVSETLVFTKGDKHEAERLSSKQSESERCGLGTSKIWEGRSNLTNSCCRKQQACTTWKELVKK